MEEFSFEHNISNWMNSFLLLFFMDTQPDLLSPKYLWARTFRFKWLLLVHWSKSQSSVKRVSQSYNDTENNYSKWLWNEKQNVWKQLISTGTTWIWGKYRHANMILRSKITAETWCDYRRHCTANQLFCTDYKVMKFYLKRVQNVYKDKKYICWIIPIGLCLFLVSLECLALCGVFSCSVVS